MLQLYILLRRSGRAVYLYCTMHSSQNLTDDDITGGFLPHKLFAGFYQQPAPRLKHNTLRGLFTIKLLCHIYQQYIICDVHM
jgi:hypothetical protein